MASAQYTPRVERVSNVAASKIEGARNPKKQVPDEGARFGNSRKTLYRHQKSNVGKVRRDSLDHRHINQTSCRKNVRANVLADIGNSVGQVWNFRFPLRKDPGQVTLGVLLTEMRKKIESLLEPTDVRTSREKIDEILEYFNEKYSNVAASLCPATAGLVLHGQILTKAPRALGDGGNGVVHRYFNPLDNAHYAVKSPKKKQITDDEVLMQFADDFREAENQYIAQYNPDTGQQNKHVAPIESMGLAKENFFFPVLMEMPLGDLHSALEKILKATDDQVLVLPQDQEFINDLCDTFFRDALKAASEAHHAGVLHRDIKALNFLIDETGTLRLADFGGAEHGDRRKNIAYWCGDYYLANPKDYRQNIRGTLTGSRTAGIDSYSIAVMMQKEICEVGYELSDAVARIVGRLGADDILMRTTPAQELDKDNLENRRLVFKRNGVGGPEIRAGIIALSKYDGSPQAKEAVKAAKESYQCSILLNTLNPEKFPWRKQSVPSTVQTAQT